MATEPSGADWVKRFPGTATLADLQEPFKTSCTAFVDAIREAGAAAAVISSFRPPERAYLMHWSWKIAKLRFDPLRVPPMVGVDIDWTHNGDGARARTGAAQMVAGYRMVFIAALTSNHTRGLAVDMEVSWRGTLAPRNGSGRRVSIESTPRSTLNQDLWRFAATHHVIKHPADRPHWSIDGR